MPELQPWFGLARAANRTDCDTNVPDMVQAALGAAELFNSNVNQMNDGLKGDRSVQASNTAAHVESPESPKVDEPEEDEEEYEDEEAYNERRRAAVRQRRQGDAAGLPLGLGLGPSLSILPGEATGADSNGKLPVELAPKSTSRTQQNSLASGDVGNDVHDVRSGLEDKLSPASETLAEAQLVEFVTSEAYSNVDRLPADILSFVAGQPLAVLQRGTEWSWVTMQGCTGWAPSHLISERPITRQVPAMTPVIKALGPVTAQPAVRATAYPLSLSRRPSLPNQAQENGSIEQGKDGKQQQAAVAPAAQAPVRSVITHRILPSACYSDLQPNTFVDSEGTVSHPLGVDASFRCPDLPADRVRAPAAMRGPAMVAHDQTWRCAIAGARYAKV